MDREYVITTGNYSLKLLAAATFVDPDVISTVAVDASYGKE
jgi:hypothetical protein